MTTDITNLYNNGRRADVRVNLNKGEITTHSLILENASGFFKFGPSYLKAWHIISFPEFSDDVVIWGIKYIYGIHEPIKSEEQFIGICKFMQHILISPAITFAIENYEGTLFSIDIARLAIFLRFEGNGTELLLQKIATRVSTRSQETLERNIVIYKAFVGVSYEIKKDFRNRLIHRATIHDYAIIFTFDVIAFGIPDMLKLVQTADIRYITKKEYDYILNLVKNFPLIHSLIKSVKIAD